MAVEKNLATGEYTIDGVPTPVTPEYAAKLDKENGFPVTPPPQSVTADGAMPVSSPLTGPAQAVAALRQTMMPAMDVSGEAPGAAPQGEAPLQALATEQVPAPIDPGNGMATSSVTDTSVQKGLTGITNPSTKTVETEFRDAAALKEEGLVQEGEAEKDMIQQSVFAAEEGVQRAGELAEQRRKHTEAQVEKEQKLRAEVDDNRKRAEATINPNRFWDNMSATRTVLTILLAGLSGATSQVTGRQDQTFNTIDNAIQRDIAAQKTDIDNARAASESGLNAHQTLRRAGLDQIDADLTLEKYAREQADLRLQSALGRAKGEATVGKLKQMIADNQAKTADIKFRLEASAQDKVAQGIRTQTGPAGPIRNVDDDVKMQKMITEEVSNDRTELGMYRNARANYANWRANRKAKADGVAIAEFVAVALKQGSFSPVFKELLRNLSWDEKLEKFGRKLAGGEVTAVMEQIDAALRNKLAQTQISSSKRVNALRRMGYDPEEFLGVSDVDEQAVSTGGEPRRPK